VSALKLSMTYRVYDAISYAGDTALMYATTYGNVEVVQGLAGCQGGCECQGLHRPHGADVSVGGRPRRGGETSQAGRGQGIALIEHNCFSFKGERIIALSLID
jgi:hypothetical protein